MPCCLPSCPTMSEQADCWDTANIPRAVCYGRQSRATEISTANLSLSADTKAKFCEGLSNDERWSLPCFMCPDYPIRLLRHFYVSQGAFSCRLAAIQENLPNGRSKDTEQSYNRSVSFFGQLCIFFAINQVYLRYQNKVMSSASEILRLREREQRRKQY